MGEGKITHGQTVDEHVMGLDGERRDGAPHGLVRSAEDIDAVDFVVVDDGYGPMDFRVTGEIAVDGLALEMGELLGVVQPFVAVLSGKDNGSRDYRPGERAAAGFIDPGDEENALGTKAIFVREIAGHGVGF